VLSGKKTGPGVDDVPLTGVPPGKTHTIEGEPVTEIIGVYPPIELMEILACRGVAESIIELMMFVIINDNLNFLIVILLTLSSFILFLAQL
jgi:hypothetical protein